MAGQINDYSEVLLSGNLEEDIKLFKEEFENGVYENEAKESLDFVRNSRVG